MTAIASGCWSCEPSPSAEREGSQGEGAREDRHRDRPPAPARRARPRRRRPAAPRRSDSRASWMTKIAFSPTMPTIMMAPTKLEMLSVIPVSEERAEDAREHRRRR